MSQEGGTAARTRPFSYEEIMNRRKSKELSRGINEEVREAENMPKFDVVVDSSARPEFISGGREIRRLSSVIERPASGENVRVNSSSREAESVPVVNGGASHDLKDPRYKEGHASVSESTHVAGKRKYRESVAALRNNVVTDAWRRDNRGETKKKIHNRSKNDERHRGDTEDKHMRRETKNASHRDETEQKHIVRGKNDERPSSYLEDRMQGKEPRNTMNRGETSKQVEGRGKNDERHRHGIVGRGQNNEHRGTHKRIHQKAKVDEQPRNDSNDISRNAYARESKVTDRYIGRSNILLEKEAKRKYHSIDNKDTGEKNSVKKPEFGRGHDSEVLEKKAQKQLSTSRHDETRIKRKKSRSPDRGKGDGERRSRSPSSRNAKFSDEKKPGDSSLLSINDRPPKQHHKDMERSKFSSNGSGNHYRGHGGSTSGLGGYSPRKRKTENVVKTPPANRSPERKSAGWDIPPAGVKESSTASATHAPPLSYLEAMPLNVHELVSAVTAALNVSKPLPGASGFLPPKSNASIDSLQLTESTRPMRRLYIENVPSSASEKDIMEYLNNHLLSSGVNHIQGKQPCISCIIHKEKCQALVEFLTPQDASAALSFDGSNFSGRLLKIRRPKDFVEVATVDAVEAVMSAPIVPLSNIVKDSPHKVFIGGISDTLSTEMLIEIAGAFGPLKAFYYEAKQDFNSRYAFLEYVDPSVTLKACVGLNGLKLGGQALTVVQALPCTESSEISEREPTYPIPDHAKPLMQKPTQVIKLKNVFTPTDMFSLSKSDVGEVLEDIRLECARFGTVKSLNVVERETLPVNNLEVSLIYHNDEKTAAAGEVVGHGDNLYLEASGDVAHTNAEGLMEVEAEKVSDHSKEKDAASEPMFTQIEPEELTEVEAEVAVDDVKKIYEALKSDVPHTESEELAELEAARVLDDKMQRDQALGLESVNAEENLNTVSGLEDNSSKQLDMKNYVQNPISLSPSCRSHDQESYLVGHTDCPESKGNVVSHVKEDIDFTKESASREETYIKEGKSTLQEACEDLLAAQNEEAKEEEAELLHRFEVGSVFVEYKRIDGSCTAAHALHGRLFDGRVVMVEYVPLEHYLAKFRR